MQEKEMPTQREFGSVYYCVHDLGFLDSHRTHWSIVENIRRNEGVANVVAGQNLAARSIV